METTQLREQIHTHIASLSTERLKVALDFLSYLKNREEEEATQELLAIPNFEQDLAEAEKEENAENASGWRNIRSDVG